MAPSSSIIRPWLPYSIKVLVKTNQTSPNSMGFASFNYGVPMATFWLHHQTLITIVSKYFVKRNQTSPNSMGLRRLITEFHGYLPAPSSDLITIEYQSTRQHSQ
ncbi:hypothetical protein EVAR_71405_1 [Eumeta japonica]|uniref:Uncharacterized protein n=1 Tax=Eumeta variegata TaxID=151549 RepID=A0A4C1SI18_EUMVA|nr:hypothetical protein EVAR_71405_1 [Eumeta japonica]